MNPMMVRPRAIIIFTIIFSLLISEGLFSRTAKPKYRPRYPKSRHVKVKKERPKPPDPALEWKECGDNCIARIFNNDITGTPIAPVKGELRDIAVRGEYLYLLVKNFNLVADAIFTIRRESGKIKSIWGIGRLGAEAMTCDGDFLWILSRSEKYFVRKLTLSGSAAGDISVTSVPAGSIRGLACVGDSLLFSARFENESCLYLLNHKTRGMKKIGSYSGAIQAVAFFQGEILAYINEFDTYSDHWLMLLSPAGVLKKKMCFINTVPAALAVDGKNLYFMEKRQGGAFVSPLVVMAEKNIVLASPSVQRIEVVFPVTGRNPNRFNADLWVPYPANRKYQNVRQISIEPKPMEITGDRFGNRWARVRWDRAEGSVNAVMKFDIITAAAAQTIERNQAHGAGGVIPDDVKSSSCGETSAFDISSYVVKSHSTRLDPNGTWLSRTLAIRDYVNGAIRFSAYGDRWRKASDYLFYGRGDAYGQTLGFAALSRYMGIPARAAGGILLEGAAGEGKPNCCAAWNQVYMPGNGWIDIGIGRDYGHTHENFAFFPNRCFITFEGDFDTSDYSSVFTESDWTRACRWSSADRNKEADVAQGPIRIKVLDLKE
jgi:hypothetical protein